MVEWTACYKSKDKFPNLFICGFAAVMKHNQYINVDVGDGFLHVPKRYQYINI